MGKMAGIAFASLTKKLRKIRSCFMSGYYCSRMPKVSDYVSIEYPADTIIGQEYIHIGHNVSIGKRAVITAWDRHDGRTFNPRIEIGNNVNIGSDVHITAINYIRIGDNTLLGKKITITDNSHGQAALEELSESPISRKLYSKGPVVIGRNVWIGDKATILPDVTIGDGAIIGANAVVTKDVPENCVATGNPAVIRPMRRKS